MPLTFPSHLAAVLPLKLWRPRWFDGVALATGAIAPDVAYLVMGTPAELPDTHSLPALLWWCLPVALAYAWIVRRSIATIAAHLPRRWRAYGTFGHVRHARWITMTSALVGSATHIGWDWLTHTDGWLRDLFGVDWYAATGVAWWTVSDLFSTVIGGIVAVVLALRVGQWTDQAGDGERPPRAPPRTFWTAVTIVGAVGLVALPFLPAAFSPAAIGVRVLHVAAAAFLAGTLAVTAGQANHRRERFRRQSRYADMP